MANPDLPIPPRRRTERSAVATLTGLLGVALSLAAAASPRGEAGLDSALLERIRAERQREELQPVQRIAILDHVARRRAESIAAEPPERRLSPATRLGDLLREGGVADPGRVIELVDIQSDMDDRLGAVWRAWRHHPPSWRLVVDPDVVAIGIGSHPTDDGSLVLVALFGKRPPAPVDTRELERRVEEAINEFRRREGLRALSAREAIRRVARGHSEDMARRGFFDHDNPDGRSPSDRALGGGLTFRAVAENIGQTLEMDDPVAAVVDGWLHSPGHLANLTGPRFRLTGVGVYVDEERGVLYFTQLFLQP